MNPTNTQTDLGGSRYNFKGLTAEEVVEQRHKWGYNSIEGKRNSGLSHMVVQLFKEPMVLLLLVASAIYFISGEWEDAIFLAVSIIFIAVISIFQDSRSKNAIAKLQQITAPKCKVIRSAKVE